MADPTGWPAKFGGSSPTASRSSLACKPPWPEFTCNPDADCRKISIRDRHDEIAEVEEW